MKNILCCMTGINMKEVFDKREELGINCMMITKGKMYTNDFPNGVAITPSADDYNLWLTYYRESDVIDYILLDASFDILELAKTIFIHNVYMVYPSVARYDEIIKLELDKLSNYKSGFLSAEEAIDKYLWSVGEWKYSISVIESRSVTPIIKLEHGQFVIDLIGKDMSEYNDFIMNKKVKDIPENAECTVVPYVCNLCGEYIFHNHDHIYNRDVRLCMECSKKIHLAYVKGLEDEKENN